MRSDSTPRGKGIALPATRAGAGQRACQCSGPLGGRDGAGARCPVPGARCPVPGARCPVQCRTVGIVPALCPEVWRRETGWRALPGARVIRSVDAAVAVRSMFSRAGDGQAVAMHLKDEELASVLSDSLGEHLLAAAYARIGTALSLARVLTPIGNYLIARPAARAAARKITQETDVPLDAAVVIGITAAALHLWRADPMLNQVGDHIGEVPLTRIAGIAVSAGRSWQPVTITLDGGERIELEGRGSVYSVANAFNEHRRQ
jgi:hypothetical protein